MIGNLYLAGLITGNIKKRKKRHTIYMNKLTEERNLLIRKKFRVSPGFLAHAEYLIVRIIIQRNLVIMKLVCPVLIVRSLHI